MERRSFFRWIAAAAATVIVARIPRWAQAQTLMLAPSETATLHALGAVVLPGAMGRAQSDAVVAEFVAWCANYKSGADLGYGYGHPYTRVSGPNPSRAYATQLHELGAGFPQWPLDAQRAAVEVALQKAGVTRIPRRPDGQHVASDLMGYFFNSAAGEDFLFQALVMRDACRGLGESNQRPMPIRS